MSCVHRALALPVLIGPVYPYKGGISHYTALLYQTLKKEFDVKMISFKFQYPKFLYKKEQKDFSNDTFKIEETDFCLHTANPINWISTAQKINCLKANMIIIQWWHPYFAPCYYLLCKLIKKSRILFICHNVFPHERFPLDHLLTKLTLQQGNYYIVQSKMDAKDLLSIINNPIYRQIVHPTYNAFKLKNISKEEARKQLQIETSKKLVLFFGFIREYKGLKYLIKAMEKAKHEVDNLELLLVGDFADKNDKEFYNQLITEYGIQEIVRIYDGYIPDKEVEKFFVACDIVVLPYISATQSGIVQIAFGFEKPVIVTNVGGLPDVVTDGKTGYVVEAENEEEIAKAIGKYFKEKRELAFKENIRNETYRFSWDRIIDVVKEL